MPRIPIRLAQLPAFTRQVVERSRVLSKPLAVQPTFHLCYFSCQSYFRYLYCALHSLKTIGVSFRYRVIVFSDTDMPLSEAQIEALQALMPDRLTVQPWPKSMGWGATQIGWIWRAYAHALAGAAEGDIIARVDSDVFFFNDRIFQAVARSDADMVGDGHYVRLEFCQGGCYFFKAHAVRKILQMLEREPLDDVVKEIDPVVEDVAATHFARRLAGSREYAGYVLKEDACGHSFNSPVGLLAVPLTLTTPSPASGGEGNFLTAAQHRNVIRHPLVIRNTLVILGRALAGRRFPECDPVEAAQALAVTAFIAQQRVALACFQDYGHRAKPRRKVTL